ncbi:MAG: M60 family metallopeptidase [Odoribacteraceae bacterium]|jgi:hypothetical protein|nr:M60 family metallopeptidase [Odoribacteraceae bacterium]
MKKYLFYPCLFLLAAVAACQENDLSILSINDERDVLLFSNLGGQEVIKINTNIVWKATVEGNESWCTATKLNKTELAVVVEQNILLEERETKIILDASEAALAKVVPPVELIVRQASATSGIVLAADTCRLLAIGGLTRVGVLASVEYEITTGAPWITYREKEGNEELFDVDENLDKAPRSTTILFQAKGDGGSKSLAVVQAGRDSVYIPGDPGLLVTDTKLKIKSSVASEAHAGEGVELSHDGNYTTIYHSRWGEETSYPVSLTYTLDEADRLDYMIYYPRQEGSNGNFKTLKVHARSTGNSVFTLLGEYDFGGASTPSRIVFSTPVTSPAEVKIEVLSGVGNNVKGFVSCAEMEFYKRTANTYEFFDLFTDKTCSELKPGVTINQVREIPEPFIRGMAASILNGDYPLADRVREYPAYPVTGDIAAANKSKNYGLLDNATGISINLNEEVVVFAGELRGRDVYLRVMDFNDGYTGLSYQLFEGMNKIKVANKGLAYIMYHVKDDAIYSTTAPPVKIHVASGQVNGLFDISRHGKDDWQPLLARTVNQHVDVLGRKVHLLFPVARYRAHCPDIVPLLEAYDRITELEQEFTGLIKYKRVPPNRVMLLVSYNPSTYMSATDYRTNYHDNTLEELMNVGLLTTTSIWGPAHEIGHVHQTGPTLSWVGLGEVSNNIYSLYVQTSFGNASRISTKGSNSETDYRRGFNEIVVPAIPHGRLGAISTDPYFQKLVPFWQVHLYAVILGKDDLYKDLHEKARTGTDKNYSTQAGEIQLDFARNVCDYLQTDLTAFFEAWGFVREIDEVVGDYASARMTITATQVANWKNEIASRSYAANKAPGGLVYLTDNTVDVIKYRRDIVKGSVSRNGNTVTTTNWQNVMAFEVYNNGVLAWVSPDYSFTHPSLAGTVTIKAVAWDGTRVNVE